VHRMTMWPLKHQLNPAAAAAAGAAAGGGGWNDG